MTRSQIPDKTPHFPCTLTKLAAVTQTGGPQWDEGAAQLSFGRH